MATQTIHSGKSSLELLKEIFNIEQSCVSRIIVDASIDSFTTLTISSYAKIADIDIAKGEVSRDDIINQSTYEITVKKIEKPIITT